MIPERWARIEEVFDVARRQPVAEREQLLATLCGGDVDLRREVESLLAFANAADDVLARPLHDDAARVVRDLAGVGDVLIDARLAGARGTFRVQRAVASGGMGTVYLATAEAPGMPPIVAVKVIRPGLGASADLVARFRAEIDVLASLDHPNIARYHDSGRTPDGRPFYAMDFVDGAPLFEACDRARWTVEQRLELFVEVCAAVAHAHGRLVVHRDLKPGNVLVDATGRPRLVDFGIARVLDGGAGGRTGEATRWMTPEYTSPEQACGDAATTRSDVYALGVLLYRLLTGCEPYAFQSLHPQEIARVVAEVEPRRPSEVVDDAVDDTTAIERAAARGTSPPRLRRRLAGDLDNIVMMALRKEPERRYATVDHLLDDVRRHLGGERVSARPDTLGYRVARFARRHRIACAAAGLVVASLAVGGTFAVWQARIAAAERQTTIDVTDLLVDVFGGVAPESTADWTAHEFLGRAAEQLASRPSLDARVRTTLWSTIGRLYERLGHYGDAATTLQRALAEAVAGLPAGDPAIGACHNALGVLAFQRGDFDAAERSFTRGREIGGAAAAPRVEAGGLLGLAELSRQRGAAEAGLALAERGFALRRASYPATDPQVVSATLGLAGIRWSAGDRDGAADLLRRARAALDGERVEDHPLRAQLLHQLGWVEWRAGRAERAWECFGAALEMRCRLFPDGHRVVADTLQMRATLALERGDPAVAEAALVDCLELRERLTPDHWHNEDTRSLLGAVLLRQQRFAAAEPLLRISRDRLVARLGPDHEHAREATERLAELYARTGRSEAAASLRVGDAGR